MKEKELRRLSRADLLEMLIDQSKEMQELKERLAVAEAELERREIIIGSSGSIAEASLRLSGIFEAAQTACEQYIDNIRILNERQISFYSRFENSGITAKSFGDEGTERSTMMQEQPFGKRRTRRRAASM